MFVGGHALSTHHAAHHTDMRRPPPKRASASSSSWRMGDSSSPSSRAAALRLWWWACVVFSFLSCAPRGARCAPSVEQKVGFPTNKIPACAPTADRPAAPDVLVRVRDAAARLHARRVCRLGERHPRRAPQPSPPCTCTCPCPPALTALLRDRSTVCFCLLFNTLHTQRRTFT